MIISSFLSMFPDMKIFDSYNGGKGSNGTYQTIINLIPPCKTLIIPFLGNCAILRNIKLPPCTIAIDKDAAVIKKWQENFTNSAVTFINGDAISFLKSFAAIIDNSETVIYCDPPYLMSSRRSQKNIYNYEMSFQDHQDLLSSIKSLRSRVLISAIKNELYDSMLFDWSKKTYMNKTRHGMQEEIVYFNFSSNIEKLQDYSFLGDDFRKREIIKRKFNRWMKKVNSLSTLQRNAFLFKINNSK